MTKQWVMGLIGILAAAATGSAMAASVDLAPTADGDVQLFGGNDVDTGDTRVNFSQSGGAIRNGILEFDLSTINDAATINSVRLDLTIVAFTSNTGSNPANAQIFAYDGDGVVDINDYDAPGIEVLNTTTPHGGSAGDLLQFTLTDINPISAALAGDLLTLRLETDNFAIVRFASLENGTLAPANLHIDFTPVPVPAALPLLATGAGLLWRRRRRCPQPSV